jgi:AraC-like DNA-binding protein
MISIMLKNAAGTGMNTQAICETVGLTSQILEDPDARIPLRCMGTIWKEVEFKTKDQDFGLHMGDSMNDYPGGNILFSVMMNCPTVGDALDKFCCYHNLMHDAIQPKLGVTDKLAFLSWETAGPPLSPSRHISEALLSIFNATLKHLIENPFHPVEVHFRHASPQDTREHQRIFQAPLLFEQPKDELVIEKQLLEKPVFLASPQLLETLERYARNLIHKIYLPNSWADKVIGLLGKRMQGENPSVESIAKELAVSVRSLQSKLSREGTTFQQLLDYSRKETAMQLLKNPEITLCDIAFMLGFSEQSVFNHAFKRWTGKTPKQYLHKGKNPGKNTLYAF